MRWIDGIEDRGKGKGNAALLWVYVKRRAREANENATNIHEFLGIRKGEFIADGGHDRLFARVEICIHPQREKIIARYSILSLSLSHSTAFAYLWREPRRLKLSCRRQRWKTYRRFGRTNQPKKKKVLGSSSDFVR